MSKENETNQIINHCVHCGAKVEKNKTYCLQCGKLIIKLKPNKGIQDEKVFKKSEIVSRRDLSRKCSGCGSIITSTVLDQCPICNSLLEHLPELQKPIQSETGFIFMNKKLELTQKFVLKNESWNTKEGISVFTSSLFLYIFSYLSILMFFWFQFGSEVQEESTISEFTIILVLLSQIPGMLFGMYPLWYIYSRKHSFEKLGFSIETKKNLLAIAIGVIGGLVLILVNLGSGYINSFLYDLGLNFYDIQGYLDLENKIIRESGLWVIILLIELVIVAISTEIVFRGVLHNTLKEKFNNRGSQGKIIVILLVALIYSAIYLFFYFPIGIYFIIPNFLVFVVLGLLYEINENIYNTIIASIFYNVLLISLIIFF